MVERYFKQWKIRIKLRLKGLKRLIETEFITEDYREPLY